MSTLKTNIVLLMGLFFVAACNDPTTRRIEVSGSAFVYAAPELARFDFTIEKRGKVLSTLKSDVDRKTARLVKLCKKLGIDPKDITAAEVEIEPKYSYERNTFLGYKVSRNVHANLYDLDKYSKVIDGAVRAGITNIQNISLELKEQNNIEDQALEKAITKARYKAELLANKSGVKLGEVLRISESQPALPQEEYKLYKGLSDRAPEPSANAVFEPGRLTITRTVYVVFGIE